MHASYSSKALYVTQLSHHVKRLSCNIKEMEIIFMKKISTVNNASYELHYVYFLWGNVTSECYFTKRLNHYSKTFLLQMKRDYAFHVTHLSAFMWHNIEYVKRPREYAENYLMALKVNTTCKKVLISGSITSHCTFMLTYIILRKW